MVGLVLCHREEGGQSTGRPFSAQPNRSVRTREFEAAALSGVLMTGWRGSGPKGRTKTLPHAQQSRWRRPCTLVGLWILVACTTTVPAATSFRWHLQPEQAYQIQVAWTSGQSRGTSFQVSEHSQAQLLWKVLGVDDQGNFTLVQTLQSVTQSVDSPGVGLVEYDSKETADPRGAAVELANYWRPLVGVEFRRRLTPRGAILLLEEPPAGQPPSTDTTLLRRDFGQDPWRGVLRGSYLQFPEQALEPDQEWNEGAEAVLPGLARRCVWTTRYKYLGPQPRDGAGPLDRFQVSYEMSVEPSSDAPTIEIQTQQSQGNLLFDADAGHLVESEYRQELQIQVTAPGVEPLRSRWNSSVRVQFQPILIDPPVSAEAPAVTP